MQGLKHGIGFISVFLKVTMFLAVLLSALWCAGALYFVAFKIETLRLVLSWLFLAIWPAAFLFYPKTFHVLSAYVLSACVIFAIWASIPPSHDRTWRGEHARMPHAEYEGDTLTVHDVRDFEYHDSRENFTPRYHTITYNLDNLEGVDLALSHWDDQVMIAHVILIFRFQNAENLAVSVETRQEQDEPWDIPRGFFNQYELISVLGTEEDLIGRRIKISQQDVFLYPTTLNKEESRAFLNNVMEGVNALYETPQFYNTLITNCSSALFTAARRPELFEWFNPELLLNGVSDRYARKVGLIEGEGTYWEFKYDHYISPLINNADDELSISEFLDKYIRKESQ